jgi:hypothetical protein
VSAALLAALFLQVGAGAGVIESARVRADAEVSFHAAVAPETVYVGQAARYELGVFIRDDIQQRLRRNPEFVPPDLRALFSYDLRETSGTRTVERNGRTYEVHRFRRALYPVAPGRIRIPPARLTYAVPLGASFFSREETRALQSEAVTIIAIQPPERGRPASWNGAVGDLTLQRGAIPAAARRGDPFVYTLRVQGEGYVGLFPRPELSIAGATAVPSDERVQVDSLPDRLTGRKEFDWLVTPDITGSLTVPTVEYAYFDPVRRQYLVARAHGGTLPVRDAEVVRVDTAAAPVLTQQPVAYATAWRSAAWPSPITSGWYWLVVLLAPLPVLMRRLRRGAARATAVPSPRLRLRNSDLSTTPGDQRALFVAALEERVGRAIPWTETAAAERVFRRAGVTGTTAARVAAAAALLDRASYGPAADGHTVPSGADLADLVSAVDREAVRLDCRHASARRALLIIPLLCGAAASAQPSRTPTQDFADGLAATSTDPRAAATAFFAAADGAPRVVVAWRNAAIASWAATDTARAVVGWQQVTRLAPLDGEAREQLRVIGAVSAVPRAAVWPVPVAALAWLGLLLWSAAWMCAWWGAGGRLVLVMAATGASLVALAAAAQHRGRGDDLAVVQASMPLRALPALGSESGASPLTGEVVQVLERGPVWARVDAGGGRVGWLDARALLALDGRPLRD